MESCLPLKETGVPGKGIGFISHFSSLNSFSTLSECKSSQLDKSSDFYSAEKFQYLLVSETLDPSKKFKVFARSEFDSVEISEFNNVSKQDGIPIILAIVGRDSSVVYYRISVVGSLCRPPISRKEN